MSIEMNPAEKIRTIRREKKMTQTEFAKFLGVSTATIASVENGSREMSKSLMKALNEKLGIKADWLLTGKSEEQIVSSSVASVLEEKKIPFYDIDVMAHISEFLDFSDETPAGMLIIPGFQDCLACFPVYGESMEPKISNGDVIAVSKAVSCEQILWGEIYLVITDAWRVVKTVHPGKTEEYIILRSINPAFAGDTPVNKTDLRALYLVRGVVSRFTM